MKFHCLFEQSGTFKNVFKSYGHEAWDYDILNDYGETDYQIDLFEQIEEAYCYVISSDFLKEKDLNQGFGRSNIFGKMKPGEDFIMAFFPCTYFSDLNEMIFKKFANTNKNDVNGIRKVLERDSARSYYYHTFIKFCFVVQELKIPTIIENPASRNTKMQYLELYSPYKVSYYEKNRSLFGDAFVKPTNYFAINFEMKENFMMYDEEHNKKSCMYRPRRNPNQLNPVFTQRERSEITPRYADNFYKRFIEHALNSKEVEKEITEEIEELPLFQIAVSDSGRVKEEE